MGTPSPGDATTVSALMTQLDRMLEAPDAALVTQFPGDRGVRQPVHTVYVPADDYRADTVPMWGRRAMQALTEHGGSDAELADLLELPPELVESVLDRVRRKLDAEPVEDLRIDFEDGYGTRPDEVEDRDAVSAAAALADAMRAGAGSPYSGIRFKSLEAATRHRGVRTLDRFVGELVRRGGLPEGLVVTLPKVTSVDQVQAMVLVCDTLERRHGLRPGRLGFEIQVETPQSILGPDGSVLLARMIHAAEGRCTGLHYGTYDYSASCGIAAEHQSMEHPAADYAKAVMQVAAAGTGVHLSDGSTNVLPVGGAAAVHAGWRLHHRLVRRSLARGFYQGWDMHPAQLVSRFVATYGFYREGLATAAERLHAYLGGGESGYLDEPATAAALAGFVLRGVDCGAVDRSEVADRVGVGGEELARLARRPLAQDDAE